jgi:GTP-binding protein Era
MGVYRSGIVAVVGKPNVGKSTMINAIVGQKVSIVSDKAQTTRRRIMGVSTEGDRQIVFIDTPGIHKATHKLGHALNETAKASVDGVDVLLIVVDSSRMPSKEDRDVALILREAGVWETSTPKILCMNKMDMLKAEDVERNYAAYQELFPADEWMMTSFTRNSNVDKLVNMLVSRLPEGPPLYPEDTVTDQSMRSLAGELVREKALHLTRQEVPHALATYVENWDEDDKLVHIAVVLLVEREGHKGIIIGKKGGMLKKIGTLAREEIEPMVGKKVFLELFVKVREDWRGNVRMLQELEYL